MSPSKGKYTTAHEFCMDHCLLQRVALLAPTIRPAMPSTNPTVLNIPTVVAESVDVMRCQNLGGIFELLGSKNAHVR